MKIPEYPAAAALDGTEQTVADQHGATVSITESVRRAYYVAAPGPIGSLTPNSGAFTTISASGVITSTVLTGTSPFSLSSTTVVPNLNASLLLGGTWAIPGTIGSTTPNSATFTTVSTSGAISQNFPGQTRSLASLGGALVREYINTVAATTGNIEIGLSYNCAVNPSTGVWAGRDITDICWLEKWSDTGGQKEFWFAPSNNSGVVPSWQKVVGIDGTTGIISSSPIDAFPNFTASVATNALTGTLTSPIRLNFRNATASTGTPVGLNITSNLTLTIPSGATLGTVNAVAARLVWLIAYNGGIPVLCVTNMAGGLQLDETNLISPTTISAGSTSASVIYSASAVSANSPYRVIGFTDITEATAGVWSTSPSTVQPIGGQALALSGLGYGQTWQAFTPGTNRLIATTYYNTTGKPIVISISGSNYTTGGTLTINGITVATSALGSATGYTGTVTGIVPVGGSYNFTTGGGNPSTWSELR